MTVTTTSVHEPNLQECLTIMADTRALCLQLLSNSSTPTASAQQRQHPQKLLAANLSRLRGLHRNMYMALRQTKQVTAEARQEQDRLHLQLQNLYYEQRHLRGEIDACLEFPYVYPIHFQPREIIFSPHRKKLFEKSVLHLSSRRNNFADLIL